MHLKETLTGILVAACIIIAASPPTNFAAPPTYCLDVSVVGQGTVVLDPPGDPPACGYDRGTPVLCTAYPADGWTFDHWEATTQIDGSTTNPDTIIVYKTYFVRAVFTTPTGIDVVRKRDTVIKVVDNQQQPVENVDVQIDMTDRAFPFGVAVDADLLWDPDYRNFVLQRSPRWWTWSVFGNESKWYVNEAVEDSVTYSLADGMADILTAYDFTLRGHCIYWAVQQWVQQWVQDLDDTNLQIAVEDRMNSVVPHFDGTFVHWDVNNEMVHGTYFKDRLGASIRPWMHNRTVELDPDVLTCVNDYNVIAGGWDTTDFITLVQDLESQGAWIDTLGVQCHFGDGGDTAEDVTSRLDSVAALGYPVWVTEFDVTNSNLETRANDLETYYRALFSHSSVEGIVMWMLEGLVNEDWTLNVAGQRYESLMNEWWTNANDISDSNGEVAFSGFHGDYEIKLTPSGGNPEVHDITLTAGEGAAQFTLELGTGSAPDTSAPSPDPMTWASAPTAVGSEAIAMTATTASDASGVEYYFANLTDPSHDSIWQRSATYVDGGLAGGTEYTYKVKARDMSLNQNETQLSNQASATTLNDGNIMANGGFEYGDPTGWFGYAGAAVTASTTQVRSGSYSGFVDGRVDTYDGPAQSLLGKMVVDNTYACSAWVRLANAASGYVQMTLLTEDTSGTNYTFISGTTAYDNQWVQLSGNLTLTAVGELTIVTLYIEGPDPGINFYVDDVSVVQTSNYPPTVSITSPLDGATFDEGADITIEADASDSDGSVTLVEFYQDSTKLGEDTSSPYSYTWNNVPAGSYSLTAKATDNEGATTTSSPPVNITVTSGGVVDMYVYDIEMGSGKLGVNYYATATVWIKDAGDIDVVGATVSAEWSGCVSETTSDVTLSDGKVTFRSPNKLYGGLFEFCVTDVTATGYTYNPALNNETCDQIQNP